MQEHLKTEDERDERERLRKLRLQVTDNTSRIIGISAMRKMATRMHWKGGVFDREGGGCHLDWLIFFSSSSAFQEDREHRNEFVDRAEKFRQVRVPKL